MSMPISLDFSETMAGFVTFDPDVTFWEGYRRGEESLMRCKVALQIRVPDIASFADDPLGRTNASGLVQCAPLGDSCRIETGIFDILIDASPSRHDSKEMRYRLFFRTAGGRELTLCGTKYVRRGAIWNLWRDTTTLFTRIFEGYVLDGQIQALAPIASGVLRLSVPAFTAELISMRASGPGIWAWIVGPATFTWVFARRLWRVYGPRA
jgi:cholesterol oxidase